jgi:hypothetical protein
MPCQTPNHAWLRWSASSEGAEFRLRIFWESCKPGRRILCSDHTHVSTSVLACTVSSWPRVSFKIRDRAWASRCDRTQPSRRSHWAARTSPF